MSKRYRSDIERWEIPIKWWIFTFYKYALFGKKPYYSLFRKRNRTYSDYQKLPPLIYSVDEIKKLYPSRYSIPISPEIVVRHEGRLYNAWDLKEFYENE